MNGRQQDAAEKTSGSLGRSFADAVSMAASKPKPSSRPFSIRLSVSERQRLAEAAGSVPLGTHIKSQLLGVPITKASRRPRPDGVLLGQILATLGRSRLSNGVADLAATVRTGTMVLTPEMEAQVVALSKEVAEVRQLLMRALGLAKDQIP